MRNKKIKSWNTSITPPDSHTFKILYTRYNQLITSKYAVLSAEKYLAVLANGEGVATSSNNRADFVSLQSFYNTDPLFFFVIANAQLPIFSRAPAKFDELISPLKSETKCWLTEELQTTTNQAMIAVLSSVGIVDSRWRVKIEWREKEMRRE